MKLNNLEQKTKLQIYRFEELLAEQYRLNHSMCIKRGIAAKKAKLLNSQVKKS